MIFKVDIRARKLTSWRGDCFKKAVAEARRENRRAEYLGLTPKWIGVWNDASGAFAAIGIERKALVKILYPTNRLLRRPR